jgi:phosphoglycolate phosphatase-like HAD superfamily hydrolase
MGTFIFDFDGTLADSFELTVEIAHQVMGHTTPMEPARIHALRGLPAREVFREVGVRWWRIPSLLTRGRKLMASRLNEVSTFPGLAPVLAEMHDRGDRLFVLSSNSADNVRSFFETNDMGGDFDKIYGGAGLFSKAGKLRQIMRENRLRPNQCWYIGDEVRDVLAARQARVQSAAVTWGFNLEHILKEAGPQAIITKPQELLRLT